ncbi:MAG: hypothetical protein IKW98_06200 [Prevotella sp.]|nr:hypothetical protein [Prevotella sp.]
MKKDYIEPKMKQLLLDQEYLMDFDVLSGPENEVGDGDIEFSKEGNTFGDESLPQMKSVWDEEF